MDALRLAINRLGEKAEWDLEELKIEMEELIVLEAPLAVTGFNDNEIDQIIVDEEANSLEKGLLEPDPKAEPKGKLGDNLPVGSAPPSLWRCHQA